VKSSANEIFAAPNSTGSFSYEKRPTADKQSSTAIGPKQEIALQQVPGDLRTVARAMSTGKLARLPPWSRGYRI
jgi:hypothetical protein